MKTCSQCRETKPTSEFGKHANKPDGLRSHCKKCGLKPPRLRECARCCKEFSFQARGAGPHLCPACEETHWRCFVCHDVKPRSEFTRQTSSRTGLTYRCRSCQAAVTISVAGIRTRKAAAVKAKYGIDLETYEAHLLAAEGVCPCCGKSDRKKMCLDHDHETGEIRGVICSACNSGIGLLGDGIAGLQRAIDYLVRAQGLVPVP